MPKFEAFIDFVSSWENFESRNKLHLFFAIIKDFLKFIDEAWCIIQVVSSYQFFLSFKTFTERSSVLTFKVKPRLALVAVLLSLFDTGVTILTKAAYTRFLKLIIVSFDCCKEPWLAFIVARRNIPFWSFKFLTLMKVRFWSKNLKACSRWRLKLRRAACMKVKTNALIILQTTKLSVTKATELSTV